MPSLMHVCSMFMCIGFRRMRLGAGWDLKEVLRIQIFGLGLGLKRALMQDTAQENRRDKLLFGCNKSNSF